MWLHFFLQTAHFALNAFAALSCFAVGYLYFDAWRSRHTLKEGTKVVGFTLLSLSFLLHAAVVESAILPRSVERLDILEIVVTVFKIVGYITIALGVWIDPLEPAPGDKSTKKSAKAFMLPGGISVMNLSHMLFPIGAGIVGLLYLRRATIGLENHIRKVAIVFFLVALSDLIGMRELFAQTSLPMLEVWVASFGVLWFVEHGLLLIAMSILTSWVMGYLLKQFFTQLFMIFTASTLIVVLLTTMLFTGLLVRQMQQEALSHLKSSTGVLTFAIDSKRGEALADAQSVAQSTEVIDSTQNGQKEKLSPILESYLVSKKQTSLVVVRASGEVIGRGEERERLGQSLSDDPFVQKALEGEAVSGLVRTASVPADTISVTAAAPIKVGSDVIGVVRVAYALDNTFVDGIHTATGLDAAVYTGDTLSAGTLVAPQSGKRVNGVVIKDQQVLERVLKAGETYAGAISILNRPYLASYAPILDIDQTPIGMIFAGRRSVEVLQTAGKSIEVTFAVTIVLLIVSVIPSYLVARFIDAQLQ